MAMITRRHWLSGELETVEVETGVFRYGGHKEDQNVKTKGIPAIRPDKPLVSTALGVIPAQAKDMTKAAHESGNTDGYYRESDGKCVFESRSGRNRELQRRNRYDGDAGYGDHCGSG